MPTSIPSNWPSTVAMAGARHPQPWEAQQAEDEDGVKDDVENGAGKLGKHGVEGIPGRLQDLFKHALENEENTGHPYIIEVGAGIVIDLRIRVKHGDQLGRKQGEQQPKGRAAEQGQEFSMGSSRLASSWRFSPRRRATRELTPTPVPTATATISI